MNDEAAFLAAIRAAPADAALRLVYADWLEERGDWRCEVLRLACSLDAPEGTPRSRWEAAKRLEELAGAINHEWMAQVMSGRVWLRFHRKTFALLGERPVLSRANVRKIERWEQRHGVSLPASVREWYSLEGAEERLKGEYETFVPHPLQRALTLARPGPHNEGEPPELPIGYWEAWESSGSARLGEAGDPSVDVTLGSEATPFSAFVFQRVWIRLTRFEMADGWGGRHGDDRPLPSEFPLLQAEGPAFGPRDLSSLSRSFMEGHHRLVSGRCRKMRNPFTGEMVRVFGPDSIVQFFDDEVRIGALCRGDPRKRSREAFWEISASSEEALQEAVVRHLWGRRALSQALTSPTQAGKRVLAWLRRRARSTGGREAR